MSLKTLIDPSAKDWLAIKCKSVNTGSINEHIAGAGVLVESGKFLDDEWIPNTTTLSSLKANGGGDIILNAITGRAVSLQINSVIGLSVSGAAGVESVVIEGAKYSCGGNDAAIFVNATTGKVGITSSTKESKCNIGALKGSENLYKIAPISFNRRKKEKDGTFSKKEYYERRDIGFLAEDIQQYLPNCAQYDEHGKLNGIHTRFIYAHAVKCIQEQKNKIDQLERRLEALEKK